MNRGDIWWVCFDPSVGTEIQKTRPAVIVSNDYANEALDRVVVVPLTSNTARVYPGECIVNTGLKFGKAMSGYTWLWKPDSRQRKPPLVAPKYGIPTAYVLCVTDFVGVYLPNLPVEGLFPVDIDIDPGAVITTLQRHFLGAKVIEDQPDEHQHDAHDFVPRNACLRRAVVRLEVRHAFIHRFFVLHFCSLKRVPIVSATHRRPATS